MWAVAGHSLQMTENDYGVALRFDFDGVSIDPGDSVRLTIKTAKDGDVKVEKSFSPVAENVVELELTQAESSLLTVGKYIYVLDWYKDGVFLYNLIPGAVFEVVNKG